MAITRVLKAVTAGLDTATRVVLRTECPRGRATWGKLCVYGLCSWSIPSLGRRRVNGRVKPGQDVRGQRRQSKNRRRNS